MILSTNSLLPRFRRIGWGGYRRHAACVKRATDELATRSEKEDWILEKQGRTLFKQGCFSEKQGRTLFFLRTARNLRAFAAPEHPPCSCPTMRY